MDTAYATIGRPEHEFGAAVNSPETYCGLMVQTLRENARRYPLKPWGTPRKGTTQASPLINHGVWKLPCSCGEHPVYSPEWQMACCFHCGVVYEGILPPVQYQEIEHVLLQRSAMTQRNWSIETIEALRAENLAHGDPI